MGIQEVLVVLVSEVIDVLDVMFVDVFKVEATQIDGKMWESEFVAVVVSGTFTRSILSVALSILAL